ncbi:MAG: hypothetical protein RIB61_06265 [Roseicyclus sp.]|jgi:anti-sigma factor RsiW
MTRPREEIEALLPFYVNGSLDAEDKAIVEAALVDDPDLQADLEALSSIRETMRADADDARSPGEFGLARLMRDLDKEPGRAAPAPAPAIARAARGRLWQIAAGVLLAIGLVQGVLLYQAGGEGFRLASGGDQTQAVMTVAFNPDAREADIRTLMLDVGVEIIAGPSAIGLYELSCTPGIALDQAFASLVAATDIVEIVTLIDDQN